MDRRNGIADHRRGTMKDAGRLARQSVWYSVHPVPPVLDCHPAPRGRRTDAGGLPGPLQAWQETSCHIRNRARFSLDVMDFSLSETERALVDSARRLALSDLLRATPATGFDHTAWQRICELGVFEVDTANTPAALARTTHLLEALGAGGADRGLLFAAGAHFYGCLWPVLQLGTPAQRQLWGPALGSGRSIGALAITEPEAGSAISALSTTAVVEGDEVILTGQKTLVTNATVADVMLLLAKEFPQRGSLGLSAFLVPTTSAGVSIRPIATVGLAGAPSGEIDLQSVRLPLTARLGPAGGGLGVLLSAMQAERTAILAGFLGAAEFDLARCHHYLRHRRKAGESASMADSPVIQHKFAEIRCRLESARWLLYRGVWEVTRGQDRLAWPAMVKKTVSEAVHQSAVDIQTLYAGAGWRNLNQSASAVQDTMAILAASGTTEVQLNTIASQLAKTLVPISRTPGP